MKPKLKKTKKAKKAVRRLTKRTRKQSKRKQARVVSMVKFNRDQRKFLQTVPARFQIPAHIPNPGDDTKQVRTIKQRFIHQWIFNGWPITSAIAWRNFGHTRLADVIWKMRKKGVKIHTEIVRGKDRFNNPVRFAVYTYISGKSKLKHAA